MNTNPTLNPWPESALAVRFSDCDMYGHLNNIWYLKYFLDAREDHIASSYGLSLASFAKQGIGWVVNSNQISYLRPALVNENVVIRSGVIDFTPQELLVEMQMMDAKRAQLKAVMWSKFVHVGLKDGKRTTHSDELTALFAQLRLGGYRYDEFDRRVGDLKTELSSNQIREIA
jgi:YbgC/YbaW family acyl-CoA thioester hydrolase